MHSKRTPHDLVLVQCSAPKRRLPVITVNWLTDATRTAKFGEKGYRKGCKPGNAGRTWAPEPLTPEETLRLLAACDDNPDVRFAARDKALLATMWRSGLRIHEALLLKPHHIDHDHREVTVLRGKGGKRRVVGIDQGALEILQPWLVIRSTLKIAADAPLFCTILPPAPGRPLWQAQVRKRMHELGAIAGIPKRVHPHGLRHSLAVDLLREGAPMPYIQRQLGHSSLATTATYLSGLGAMEHVAFVSAREWPGGAS